MQNEGKERSKREKEEGKTTLPAAPVADEAKSEKKSGEAQDGKVKKEDLRVDKSAETKKKTSKTSPDMSQKTAPPNESKELPEKTTKRPEETRTESDPQEPAEESTENAGKEKEKESQKETRTLMKGFLGTVHSQDEKWFGATRQTMGWTCWLYRTKCFYYFSAGG